MHPYCNAALATSAAVHASALSAPAPAPGPATECAPVQWSGSGILDLGSLLGLARCLCSHRDKQLFSAQCEHLARLPVQRQTSIHGLCHTVFPRVLRPLHCSSWPPQAVCSSAPRPPWLALSVRAQWDTKARTRLLCPAQSPQMISRPAAARI